MAKAETRAAWGIDIGQAGLKAIKLKYVEGADQVMAVAFDYIPHPKILSQPDANPEELINQALETFLTRNQIKGDLIALSLPGQSAFTKFIPLPPVEVSRLAQIVQYEAKQQIPFPLDDVVWAFEPVTDGANEGDFLLDCKVGLFASKRENIRNTMAPFVKRKIEVDVVQISTISMFNCVCHEMLGMRPGQPTPERDDYVMVLEMGTDNTALLLTNGKDVMPRTVPMGGNHFTRALTKEMKLTFAKAEHLKCNATKAPDPKAIFQALRPVFNDYAAEIQRSIGWFSSLNRTATISKVYGMGGGFKLAGLQKFLQQNLQMDVERVDAFDGLVGDTVMGNVLFQENLPSFGVAYGLALQGLKVSKIKASLMPPEILTARLIRQKKPFAIAAAAVLLLGLSASSAVDANMLASVSEERFGDAEKTAKTVTDAASTKKAAYDGAVATNKKLKEEIKTVLKYSDGREHWAEVYKAINECLPRDNTDETTDISMRHQIRIMKISTTKHEDLSAWYSKLTPEEKKVMTEAEKTTGPTGPGYVFTLKGRHYHHDEKNPLHQYVAYVQHTLIHNLQQWEILAPGSTEPYPVRKLGISHACITSSSANPKLFDPNRKSIGAQLAEGGAGGAAGYPSAAAGAPAGAPVGAPVGAPAGLPTGAPGAIPGAPGGVPAVAEPPSKTERKLYQTEFEVQFAWRETPAEDRKETDPAAPAPAATEPAAAPPAAGVPAPTAPGAATPVPPAGVPATPAVPPTGTPNPTTPAIPAGSPPATPTGPAVPPTGSAVPAGPPSAPGIPGSLPPTTPAAPVPESPPGVPATVPAGAPPTGAPVPAATP